MIEGVVFDFDGVLADSEPLHLRALQEIIAPLGIAVSATNTTHGIWATTMRARFRRSRATAAWRSTPATFAR